MKNLSRFALLALALALSASQAMAGIIINGTRVIYPAQAREVTVQISNVGESPALIQAWVDGGDPRQTPESSTAPFLITPPISRVEPGSGQALRLFFTGAALPGDRESLFWLNVLEIPPAPAQPSQDGAQGAPENFLQLAFRSRVKLFYRPKGLPGSANDAPGLLKWSLADGGGVLRVENPTPYHLTLTALGAQTAQGRTVKVDEKSLSMLAPGQTADFALEAADAASAGGYVKVTFTTINDYGGLPERSADLGD